MAPAHVLAFDHQHASRPGEPCAEACPGDPAADNQDVKCLHRGDGYGLESHSV